VGQIDDVDHRVGISSCGKLRLEHTVQHAAMPHARRKSVIGKNSLRVCIIATRLVLYQRLVEGLDVYES
jgi:hypothetical protein